ncbi:hypothetical protein [Pandoraea apista]|uniref:Uncharacterized protein n=1 Tax=Pandoraea apista TaxID=93218 RepID=A0A5E5P8H3_9BURK|nr:hypothetical protein [Pandoraea apista]OXS94302.1 hypothetical protein B7H01_12530 [Pandoraea apista]VVG72523.1 hypothetical protein PAP18089_03519 [Pandoraea apista]
MTVIAVRKLEKYISQALLEWLAPFGFIAADGGGVERWHRVRYDFIGAVVNRVGGQNRISPFGQMGFSKTQAIYAHFMSDNPHESKKIAVDVQLKYAHFVKSWTEDMLCEEMDQLDEFLGALRCFVLDRLYPALLAFDSPEKVLAAYLKKNEKDRRSFDPPTWFGCSSALTCMILARLYSPDHYASLKLRYAGEFEGVDEDKLSRAKRLIAYLDQPGTLPPL